MPPRMHTTGLLVLAIVSALTLLPASALAQAGLTGDPFSGQAAQRNSKYDQGFQSKSALGQLEELTGTTVDRSSSNRSTVTRVAPQSRAAQPRYNPNQEIAGALAGALFSNLFDFSDDSAQQRAAAEQAAAQAAAQAEAFRVHQEAVRVARIQRAQHYRAEWDAREAEIGDRLGGAFDVTTSGTAFFGRPANPDADTVAAILGQDVSDAELAPGEAPDVSTSDASVVDLRGSSLVVQLLRPPVPAARLGRGTMPARSTTRAPATSRWTHDLSEPAEPPPPPSSLNQLNELIAYFGPALGKYYWETVIQGTAKATLWGRVKNVRGMKSLSALAGFSEQWKDGTEELGGAYTESLESTFGFATDAAYVLGNGNPNSNGDEFIASTSGSLDYQVRKLKVKISEMLFTGFTDHSEQIDAYELETPVGEGNVVPLNDVPDHPDAYRLRSILFF